MYQPDTIKAFEINGTSYFITANEGDASEVEVELNGDDELIFAEEERVEDLTLDPTAFPNAATLQLRENLGRLEVTNTLGDTDGDGDFDEIYAYGGRSFSIWAADGSLVSDSGSMIEQKTAELFPADFNTDNDENDFDGRSDAKGPEPEAVAVGEINGETFAFVGLERFGGVMIFNITDPTSPTYETFLSGRDFDGDPEAEPSTAGDLAPESITFIPAADSPNDQPLLMVANEVSGTITFYTFTAEATRLQLFHASDLEGGSTENLSSAQNFAAIIDGLKNAADTAGDVSLTLSAGDNYLPGPIFGAAGARGLRNTFRSILGNPNAREGAGRADIAIMNLIGFEASALGNHEFDAGTTVIEDNIGTDIRSGGADPRWLGADFPYLSANLDFSEDPNISSLATISVLENTEFTSPLGATPGETLAGATAPKLAASTIIRKGNQTFGVIGATTQRLSLISSPGAVRGLAGFEENMERLAAVLQPQINEVLANGVNKVILLTHLQDINLEKQLVGLLSGVDIIIAGGSDTLQASAGDRLNAGDTAVEDYPFLTTNKDGEQAVIVSTDGQYSYVGKLVVDFDAGGVLTAVDDAASRPIPTDELGITEAGWASVADAFANGTPAAAVKVLTEGTDSLTGLEDIINVADGNIFGQSLVFLEGRRERVRTEETNLGNLTATANLWQAQQVEPLVCVSLKNGGGIRAAIGRVNGDTGQLEITPANPSATPPKAAGDISQLDIENSLRFNNGLTLQTVTAQQLREIIEHGVARSGPGSTPGQFPQVAGAHFVFDETRTAIDFTRDENGFVTGVTTPGERVRFLAIVDETTGEAKDILVSAGQLVGNPERPIRMVTLDFLAGPSFAPAGGDGYPMAGYAAQNPGFANRRDLKDILTAPGIATFTSPGSEQDAFAEYLMSAFNRVPFVTPDSVTDQRIIRGEDSTDADGDGFNASAELALGSSDNTVDPVVAAAIAAIRADSQRYGLFTEQNIQDLRGTGLIIQAQGENISLNLPLEQNSSLNTNDWTPSGQSLEATFPRAADKAFYRINLGVESSR